MTFKTWFCPRMFRDIPATGRWPGSKGNHWCIDCAAILLWRRVKWALGRER